MPVLDINPLACLKILPISYIWKNHFNAVNLILKRELRMDYKGRTKKLANSLKASDLDAVVLTTLPNLRYFFNYSGASFERLCCVLVSMNDLKSALILPKLDTEKAKSSPLSGVYPWTDNEGYSGPLTKALSYLGINSDSAKIGCEDGIFFWQMEALRSKLANAKFQSISEKITKLRLRKDEEEIESLRNIAKILAKGYKAAEEDILKKGITENEAGFEIRKTLLELGAASVDFCAIQSGSNGAIPHLETTSKKIDEGDSIVVDISCTNEAGYFADFTRTFVVGKPSEKLTEIHSVVKKAQNAATSIATPGLPAEEVDKAARSVIEEKGYGEYFFHRTGHGLGLEVHEPPWMKKGNKMKLESGMVFTVEPGVYISGELGVRIEDDLIVTESGKENLTKLSHDLIEV